MSSSPKYRIFFQGVLSPLISTPSNCCRSIGGFSSSSGGKRRVCRADETLWEATAASCVGFRGLFRRLFRGLILSHARTWVAMWRDVAGIAASHRRFDEGTGTHQPLGGGDGSDQCRMGGATCGPQKSNSMLEARRRDIFIESNGLRVRASVRPRARDISERNAYGGEREVRDHESTPKYTTSEHVNSWTEYLVVRNGTDQQNPTHSIEH